MLDVCLLGTAGMMPLPYRFLTSLMTRYNGSSLLVDCGEATQIAVKKAGWSFHPIDLICFTHYHADHISGLPGMLLTMGNADRTQPVTLLGPKGLKQVVSALRVIAPELPFEVRCVEITEAEQVFNLYGYKITAFKVNHNVPCYGYTVEIGRQGRFQPENAQKYGLPQRYWGILQKGTPVEYNGHTYTPDMVMGPVRRGIKLTYCTDTRPADSLVKNARGADLLICEGMYAEKEKLAKARQYKHMTFYEAAKIAKDADVKELWLTHFSPSLVHAADYMPQVRSIFENSHLGKDGKMVVMNFPDEEDSGEEET